MQRRVDEIDHRTQELMKITSGIHIDDTKIQAAIATRLELFKKDLDIARLSSKVEEQQAPTSVQSLSLKYNTIQTELDDHFEDEKSKDKKIEQLEKELNDIKTTVSNLALRLTIIVAIAGFALGKGADLVIKYLIK
jgi:predicted RNase H-like nuclease (RuvC/YqgF family)